MTHLGIAGILRGAPSGVRASLVLDLPAAPKDHRAHAGAKPAWTRYCPSLFRHRLQSRFLLKLDRAARLFELLLDLFGLGFADAFLDRLGGAVDQVLGLLEAESGQLAHHLDNLDLLVAGAGQHHREFILLDRRRRGCAAACRRRCRHRNRSGRRDAEFLLELLHQRRRIHQAQVLEIILNLVAAQLCLCHLALSPCLARPDRAARHAGTNKSHTYAGAGASTAAGASGAGAPAPFFLPIASITRASAEPDPFSNRTSRVAGACKSPSSCAMTTSRGGRVASACTSSAESPLPPLTPPRTLKRSPSSRRPATVLATVTGSP